MHNTRTLPPGSTIGIVGGGQLGRMTALAAARLGYRVHVFTPERDSPTEQVADQATVAEYTDLQALERFAKSVDVVTFEFENIPAESVRVLSDLVPVRPDWSVLEIAQDRIREKTFFNSIGIKTAPWASVESAEQLEQAVAKIGRPAILKTTRLGYDGKGQVKITDDSDLTAVWDSMGGASCILEGFVPFQCEVSVIVARGADGACSAFETTYNVHEHHILKTSTVPAPIDQNISLAAEKVACQVAQALDLEGLLAVEMFVAEDGHILANEMAPRPHNSGHWTIDACYTDQFEQLVRAVCRLPLGSPARHSRAQMTNLIGDDVGFWLEILRDPKARLHLYGKAEARPGRKMGHVTRLFDLNESN